MSDEIKLPGTEELEGTLYEFPAARHKEETQEAYTELELRQDNIPMLPLKERKRIFFEQERVATDAALSYQQARYIQGEQVYAIRKDQQYLDAKDKRGNKYVNFLDYCKEELRLGKSAAYDYFRFYLIVKHCRENEILEPQNPHQMRAFVGVEDERLGEKWEQALEVVEPSAPMREIANSINDNDRTIVQTNSELKQQVRRLEEELHHSRSYVEERLPERDVVTVTLPDGSEVHVKDLIRKASSAQAQVERLKARGEEMEATLKEQRDILQGAYLEEVAKLKARYGDDEVPDWEDISEDSWVAAFENAKSERVKQVAKIIRELYSRYPERVSEYGPDEAAAAVLDMLQVQDIYAGLTYVHDWIGRALAQIDEAREDH